MTLDMPAILLDAGRDGLLFETSVTLTHVGITEERAQITGDELLSRLNALYRGDAKGQQFKARHVDFWITGFSAMLVPFADAANFQVAFFGARRTRHLGGTGRYNQIGRWDNWQAREPVVGEGAPALASLLTNAYLPPVPQHKSLPYMFRPESDAALAFMSASGGNVIVEFAVEMRVLPRGLRF